MGKQAAEKWYTVRLIAASKNDLEEMLLIQTSTASLWYLLKQLCFRLMWLSPNFGVGGIRVFSPLK